MKSVQDRRKPDICLNASQPDENQPKRDAARDDGVTMAERCLHGVKSCLGDLPERLQSRVLWHELAIGGRLAGPILLGQCAQMLSPMIDTVMAGRVSPEDLSAVALGNTIWVGVMLFSAGLLGAIQPLVSNALGARKYSGILPLFKAGCWMAVLLTFFGFIVFAGADPLMHLSGAQPHLVEMAGDYLVGLSIGILPCFLIFAARGYCEGLGDTRIIMHLWCLMALVNIPLNFLFIHGYGPVPALGGVGCGYASGVMNWIGLFVFLFWAYRRKLLDLATWGLTRATAYTEQPTTVRKAFMAIARLGLPSAFHLLVEGLTFSGMAMILAVFGPTVIAANQVALNITSFLFMFPLSIGFAFTIRVAYLRGAGHFTLVMALAKSSIWVGGVAGAFLAIILLVLGEVLVGFYTEDPSVVALASTMLMVAATFQLLDFAQVLWVAILRGFEDTKVAMWINLLAHWGIGLPLGVVLARTDWLGVAIGPVGLWFGLLFGLLTASILLFFRMRWVLTRLQTSNEALKAVEHTPRTASSLVA